MTGLLPFRPRPEAGELYSSWLVRLAWANGQPLLNWLRVICPEGQHFHRDLDWKTEDRLLAAVTAASGLSREHVDATTLEHYRGRLFPVETQSIPGRWLLYSNRVIPRTDPQESRKRLVEAHGLQCCPDCLATGEPYYRLGWRLAYATVCTVHGRLLIDRCPACERPLNFRHSPPAVTGLEAPLDQIARCGHCGFDWRDLSFGVYNSTELLTECGSYQRYMGECHWGWIQPDLMKHVHGVGVFQRRIDRALETGFYPLADEQVPVGEFMAGLAHLAHLLTRPSSAKGWRAAIHKESGRLPEPQMSDGQARFGGLRVDVRFDVMGLLTWLLNDWPARFHRCCVAAQMSKSFLTDPAEPVAWLLKESERYDGFVRRPHLRMVQPWNRDKFPKRANA